MKPTSYNFIEKFISMFHVINLHAAIGSIDNDVISGPDDHLFPNLYIVSWLDSLCLRYLQSSD